MRPRQQARQIEQLGRRLGGVEARGADQGVPWGGFVGLPAPEYERVNVKVTAVDGSTPPKYSWVEQGVAADGTLFNLPGGRTDLGLKMPLYERNGRKLTSFPVYAEAKRRALVSGLPAYEFDAGGVDPAAVRDLIDRYPEDGSATTVEISKTCLTKGLLTIVDGVFNLDGTPMPDGVEVVVGGVNAIQSIAVPEGWSGGSVGCRDAVSDDCCEPTPLLDSPCCGKVPATLTLSFSSATCSILDGYSIELTSSEGVIWLPESGFGPTTVGDYQFFFSVECVNIFGVGPGFRVTFSWRRLATAPSGDYCGSGFDIPLANMSCEPFMIASYDRFLHNTGDDACTILVPPDGCDLAEGETLTVVVTE